MGRNEIRLRQKMSSGRIARHRNYEELMIRHERGARIRRFAVATIYVIIFISVLFFFILLKQRTQKATPGKPKASIGNTFSVSTLESLEFEESGVVELRT